MGRKREEREDKSLVLALLNIWVILQWLNSKSTE
jgi:hypothetical protein